MKDPKELLNRGLGVIDREITKLEQASEEEEGVGQRGRDDLCAYMNVLYKLVGKDLGGADDMLAMTDEELMELAGRYVGDSKRGKGKNTRRKRKTKANEI